MKKHHVKNTYVHNTTLINHLIAILFIEIKNECFCAGRLQ